MVNSFEYPSIMFEENRIIKWFLLLFYTIIPVFDFCYYYILPNFITHKKIGFQSAYGYMVYLVILGLLPIAKHLNKDGKQHLIKYIYFVTYILVVSLTDFLTYYGSGKPYASGNIVEVFLILFSPLFINTNFFWLVSLGVTVKYIFVGVIIHSFVVFIPIVFIFIISLMAFLLLNRFQGYVNAIKDSYYIQSEEIVKAIIATLELKDPYTRGHSERVASYALSLAIEVGDFSEEELKSFNYACLLHDIGKIHVPDQILMKPSKLTKEEFDIIKSHPLVGAEAVKSVSGLKNNISVIRSHHERWDGSGYPDQLFENETPLLARITAIADAFDAMTSSRSYRDAMPVEEAFDRIIKGSGSQFDPVLVDKFKKVYPKWIKFHKNYEWRKNIL